MNKKILIAIFMVLLTTLLLGCTQNNAVSNFGLGTEDKNNTNTENINNTNLEVEIMSNEVKVGDSISVNYTGKLVNGEFFDSSIGREPLAFTAGAGQMIKGFDDAVIGMKIGDKKTITLKPSEAYGEVNPQAIITVDANELPNFDQLQVGMELASSNGARGTITAKTDTNAVIDFNHSLAGKTLIFEIELVSIGN
jgi:FKBP-type peptidyl-prolyl cis-trans isomerase 2